MAFAAGTFVAVVASGGSIYAAGMSHPDGAIAYEDARVGGADALGSAGAAVTVGGRLVRAGNGVVGLSFLDVQSAASTGLAAKQASAGAAAADIDVGAFWTGQVATVNLCNLPANFGPGNGNWTAANVLRLEVRLRRFIPGVAAAGGGSLVHHSTTLVNGDITIFLKNCSLAALATAADIAVSLRYRHSIES